MVHEQIKMEFLCQVKCKRNALMYWSYIRVAASEGIVYTFNIRAYADKICQYLSKSLILIILYGVIVKTAMRHT